MPNFTLANPVALLVVRIGTSGCWTYSVQPPPIERDWLLPAIAKRVGAEARADSRSTTKPGLPSEGGLPMSTGGPLLPAHATPMERVVADWRGPYSQVSAPLPISTVRWRARSKVI